MDEYSLSYFLLKYLCNRVDPESCFCDCCTLIMPKVAAPFSKSFCWKFQMFWGFYGSSSEIKFWFCQDTLTSISVCDSVVSKGQKNCFYLARLKLLLRSIRWFESSSRGLRENPCEMLITNYRIWSLSKRKLGAVSCMFHMCGVRPDKIQPTWVEVNENAVRMDTMRTFVQSKL